MVRLVLFDLGDTLICNNAALPYAQDAVKTIRQFELDEDHTLPIGIVSDDAIVPLVRTESQIAGSETQFLDLLATTGFSELFEPFEECVTIATRAGFNKPDRRIFEVAIQRSKLPVTLEQCLFVSENTVHLAACRNLGMRVLRFGLGTGIQPAFSDWRHAPLLVAALIGNAAPENRLAAAGFFLQTAHGIRGFEGDFSGNAIRGQAHQQVKLDAPQLGSLDGIAVDIPVDVAMNLRPDGDVDHVQIEAPTNDSRLDAVVFVQSLMDNGKIALPDHPSAGATHAIERGADGIRRLIRTRYSHF